MAHRAFLGVMFGVGLATCAAVACGNYVPPDVGTYGPPNGLANNKAPEPPATNEDSGSGSSSGGGSDGGGSSSGGGTNYLCQQSGGTIVDAGACSVSFKGDIFPKLQATGTWGCAGQGSCHGASANSPDPLMFGLTAEQDFYKVLANMKFPGSSGTVPYVNPCSTDPAQSAFVCNTLATGACGSPMPLTPTAPLTAADQTMVATWVACGSPNN